MKRTPLTRNQGTARASAPAIRQKRCAHSKCRQWFTPSPKNRATCSVDCGVAYGLEFLAKEERKRAKATAMAAKIERASDRERRAALKSLSDLADDAQDEVNRYVRLRDWNEGCISCDKPASWGGKWEAGHLRTVGASRATRFIVWAIRKQCHECNHPRAGNAAEMYRRMVEKFGHEKLDWLYSQNHIAKFKRDYLVRLKLVFRRKANRREKRNVL